MRSLRRHHAHHRTHRRCRCYRTNPKMPQNLAPKDREPLTRRPRFALARRRVSSKQRRRWSIKVGSSRDRDPDRPGTRLLGRLRYPPNEARTRVVARGRIELPTRGFSEIQVVDSIHIYQPVTGTSVAQFASLCMTMHSCYTQDSRTTNTYRGWWRGLICTVPTV